MTSKAPIVDSSVLHDTAASVGVTVPETYEADFTELLAGARDAMEEVVSMDDYIPLPDLTRFPRTQIARPPASENPYNAWAYKAVVKAADGDPALSGVLAGKTVTLKDNVCLAGVPCEFGTAVFTDWVPKLDATIVTRMLEAGATITGKATCENFCAYGVSTTAAQGPVGNPYDKTRDAGGSSSGCGVLVAIGEADMAIGCDQGGSIRIPAAHCGIVGLKPTFGLVPYTGIISSETSIDHAGPMTKDVLSNALLLQVIAGVDGLDDRQIAGTPLPSQVTDYVSLLSAARASGNLLSVEEKGITRKLRIGILKESEQFKVMDPRIVSCIRQSAKHFEALGAEVIEISIPMHAQAPLIARVHRLTQPNSVMSEGNGTRQIYLNDLIEQIVPWTQEKFDKLWYISKALVLQSEYVRKHYPQYHGKTHNLIRKLQLEYNQALSNVDVLLMPTLPWVAKSLPPLDALPMGHFKGYEGLVTNTIMFDVTGHPALSVPCGMLPPPEGPEDLRLPVGMQLVGKFHDELTLYKAALAWSDAYDWRAL